MCISASGQKAQQENGFYLYHSIKGSRSPIILIHGGGTDSRVWNGIALIVSKKFKLIAYDLLGLGKSPIPTDTTNHVKDLETLFTKLELKNAVIVRHALGDQIATDFALLNPKKVSGLVCISPGLTGFEYDSAYQEMAQRIWKALPNIDSMLHIMLHSPKAYALEETMNTRFAKEIVLIHRENISKSLCWENFEQEWPVHDTAEQLYELDVPTLFIHGSADKQDILKIKEHYQKAPIIRFQEIYGADHGILIPHSTRIAELILQFIK